MRKQHNSVMQYEYDFLFKLLLIGDSNVGKSNLLLRFTEDSFVDSYISTIGVDFKVKTIQVGDKSAKLQIWDTAGEERFRTITSSYYRGSHAIFICFDLTDESSYENIKSWMEEKERYCPDSVYVTIVGTKSDLRSKRKVLDEATIREEVLHAFGSPYIETSAKICQGVEEAFAHVCIELMKTHHQLDSGTKQILPKNAVKLIQQDKKPNGFFGCC